MTGTVSSSRLAASASSLTGPSDTALAVDAERTLIASALVSARAADAAVGLLRPQDFSVPDYGTIFGAVGALVERGDPVDAISVGDELARAGLLTASLTIPSLHAVTDWAMPAVSVPAHAGIVRDHATRRGLQRYAVRIGQAASDATLPPAAALDEARAALDEIEHRGRVEAPTVADSVEDWLAGLDSPHRLVATPWSDVDELIGGWSPGGLHVIAARPGGGKSILGLQAALHAARRGPVVVVSLEMSRDDVLARLAAQTAGVNVSRIIRHTLHTDEALAVRDAMRDVARLPLRIVTSSEVSTIGDVLAVLRQVRREDDGLQLVVIDYLQLLHGDGRPESRQVEVASFSRSLKLAAGRLDVPIIALSQLRRNDGRAPQLHDLRESGAIEQDADVVLLLHRDVEADPTLLEVEAAKSRHGRMDRLSLEWHAQYSRVLDRRWSPTAGL